MAKSGQVKTSFHQMTSLSFPCYVFMHINHCCVTSIILTQSILTFYINLQCRVILVTPRNNNNYSLLLKLSKTKQWNQCLMEWSSIGNCFTGLVKSFFCWCQNRGRNVSSWTKISTLQNKAFLLMGLQIFPYPNS